VDVNWCGAMEIEGRKAVKRLLDGGLGIKLLVNKGKFI
jgi:hypothetical protein